MIVQEGEINEEKTDIKKMCFLILFHYCTDGSYFCYGKV